MLTRALQVSVLLLPSACAINAQSKRGLAWPNANWVPLAGFTAPQTLISAYYNWGPSPLLNASVNGFPNPNPFPFVPMLWGCTPACTAPFLAALDDNWGGRALTADKAILAFNEPDLAAQANCTPQEAGSLEARVAAAQGERVSPGQSGSDERARGKEVAGSVVGGLLSRDRIRCWS
jgi:hypothetical protein